MADVLSFAEVLAEVRTTSVSGIRTAHYVAELLLDAQGFFTVDGVQTECHDSDAPASAPGFQRRSQHPQDHETGRNKDTF